MKPRAAFTLLILTFASVIGLAGCKSLPDLVVAPAPNDVQYCNTTPDGLVVTVRNQGLGDAGKSILSVSFDVGTGSPSVATPNIPAIPHGGEASVTVPMPPSCWRPDCHFTITADSATAVPESDETNNTVNGTCIG